MAPSPFLFSNVAIMLQVRFIESTVHEGHSTLDFVISSRYDDYELKVPITQYHRSHFAKFDSFFTGASCSLPGLATCGRSVA